MSDDSEFSTPCIGVCQYDNEDICRGCFRTLDEISNWALMTEEERTLTAYHEAGHAIVTINEDAAHPIHKATIIPRGRALGMGYAVT